VGQSLDVLDERGPTGHSPVPHGTDPHERGDARIAPIDGVHGGRFLASQKSVRGHHDLECAAVDAVGCPFGQCLLDVGGAVRSHVDHDPVRPDRGGRHRGAVQHQVGGATQ